MTNSRNRRFVFGFSAVMSSVVLLLVLVLGTSVVFADISEEVRRRIPEASVLPKLPTIPPSVAGDTDFEQDEPKAPTQAPALPGAPSSLRQLDVAKKVRAVVQEVRADEAESERVARAADTKQVVETLRRTARIYRSVRHTAEEVKKESLRIFEKESEHILQTLKRQVRLPERLQDRKTEDTPTTAPKPKDDWERAFRDMLPLRETRDAVLPMLAPVLDEHLPKMLPADREDAHRLPDVVTDMHDRLPREVTPDALPTVAPSEMLPEALPEEVVSKEADTNRLPTAVDATGDDEELPSAVSHETLPKQKMPRLAPGETVSDLRSAIEQKKQRVADDVERILTHSLKGEVPPRAIGTVLGASLEEVAKEVQQRLGAPLPVPISERSRQVVTRVSKKAERLQEDLVKVSTEEWEALYRDSDGDGVSDYDEIYVFKTDPHNPHTAGSPLTDAQRILLGLDPHSTSTEQIPVESPKQTGEVVPELFEVTRMEKRPEGLRIEGTALPNSFVTIFVYSTPVVVTVRADDRGRWYYTLKTELESGKHELYVATVNSAGRIVAKSPKVPFTVTAEAVQFEPLSAPVPATSPIDVLREHLVVVGVFVLALFLTIGVMVVGLRQLLRSENTMAPQHLR